jgi:hydrogenase maturation protease
MNRPRVLVAGIGNIFLGDDAFGVEVARRLGSRKLPDGVAVVDFGIRAMDLTYALLEGYEAVILVDAAPRGGPPGTLYVLEPERGGADEGTPPAIETHNMDPVKVLRLAEALGGRVERLVVVGCEPSAVDDPEEMRAEMSAPVSTAVDEAIPLIESLVGRVLRGESIGAN